MLKYLTKISNINYKLANIKYIKLNTINNFKSTYLLQ